MNFLYTVAPLKFSVSNQLLIGKLMQTINNVEQLICRTLNFLIVNKKK